MGVGDTLSKIRSGEQMEEEALTFEMVK